MNFKEWIFGIILIISVLITGLTIGALAAILNDPDYDLRNCLDCTVG